MILETFYIGDHSIGYLLFCLHIRSAFKPSFTKLDMTFPDLALDLFLISFPQSPNWLTLQDGFLIDGLCSISYDLGLLNEYLSNHVMSGCLERPG